MVTRPERVRSVSLTSRGTFWVLRQLGPDDVEQLLSAHRRSAEEGRWLKRNQGTLVTMAPLGEGLSRLLEGVSAAVVKQSRLPWRRRLAHRFGSVSRFCRDFEVRDRLSALGIASPDVLAASHRPRGRHEYEVTVHVSASSTLRECLWLGETALQKEEERAALLRRLGLWLRKVHDVGLWQRDLKPNNILVGKEQKEGEEHGEHGEHGEQNRAGKPERDDGFLLLDITAVRFYAGPLGEDQRTRNLAQVLDLPAALDAEAAPALLAGYSGNAAESRRLEDRVREEIRARRERRRSRTGFLYVDDEHFRHGARP